MAVANEMKRQSYIADMEYKYVLALRFPVYQTGEKTQYFHTICEYIDQFFDIFDVVQDIKPYLELFGISEAAALRGFIRTKLDEEEANYNADNDEAPHIKFIRWRLIFFKLNKLLGAFSNLGKNEKLKLVNTIIQTYLWA